MIHIDLFVITAWAAVMGFLFVFLVIRIKHNLKLVQAHQQETIARLKTLRIHKMLSKLGISISHYLRKARITAIERHLFACQQCSTTDKCDDYLNHGKQIDEKTFCPNFIELERYRREHKR